MQSKIFFDFEYRHTNEFIIDLVACCTFDPTEDKVRAWWLYKDEAKKEKLKQYISSHMDHEFVQFGASAEPRSMLSLGVDISSFVFFDCMIAYRLLHNIAGTEGNISKHSGLIDICRACGQRYSHEYEKKDIRDIILKRAKFTLEEENKILLYCADDTKVLVGLQKVIEEDLCKAYPEVDPELLHRRINTFSKFGASMARCEATGIPLNESKVNNLIKNYKVAKFFIIEKCNYPFYVYNHRSCDFTFKKEVFYNYIASLPIAKDWPKTDTGKFSAEADVLEQYRHVSPHIASLHDTNKIVNTLRYFNPNNCVIKEYIGSDNRLRPYLNPFGTISARNAPPASQFIFAMPSVFRALIDAPEGKVITSADWSAQEFALAAIISGCPSMIESYRSGDPYLWFAKAAGAIPPEGKKETHRDMRNLFKSTSLGLLYGVGPKSLHIKLSQDMKRPISDKEAKQLIELHQKTYPTFWIWVRRTDLHVKSKSSFFTRDGWSARSDGSHILTYRNWPIQSAGAVLMRAAVMMAHKKGLKVICPLHDAIYIEHDEGSTSETESLKECMDKAFNFYFKDSPIQIRIDISTHGHGSEWIEDKAKDNYAALSPFFKPNPDVKIENYIPPQIVMETLFKELNDGCE